jgi:hypothetical protein
MRASQCARERRAVEPFRGYISRAFAFVRLRHIGPLTQISNYERRADL